MTGDSQIRTLTLSETKSTYGSLTNSGRICRPADAGAIGERPVLTWFCKS